MLIICSYNSCLYWECHVCKLLARVVDALAAQYSKFYFPNFLFRLPALSSHVRLFEGRIMEGSLVPADAGVDSDVSTDDGDDDIRIVSVAVLQWMPCPWIKFAHGVLLKAFCRSNHFDCHRVVEWRCYRRVHNTTAFAIGEWE